MPLEAALSEFDTAEDRSFAFERLFVEHYGRVVDIIFRLVSDRSQAEELAVDVFLKLHRRPSLCRQENIGGWLYRTALRAGLDSLKRASRRRRHEQAAAVEARRSAQPHDPLHDIVVAEKRARVRAVLAALKPKHAELLILRSTGLSYKELAGTLKLNAASVGTLLARAESEFEKKYRALNGGDE
jgi:RNA polymerase sigma-70 factor (ECF subfamily)